MEKSGGFPSPQVQTETDPSAHSGAERLSLVMTEEKSSRETSNMLSLQPKTNKNYVKRAKWASGKQHLRKVILASNENSTTISSEILQSLKTIPADCCGNSAL